MLKILILFTLVLNIAFAKDRFTDADKTKFLNDVKLGIAEHKVENKGKVDLQIIKPGLYAELEEYQKQQKFTREEMLTLKQHYENFSKDPNNTSDKAEAAFYTFIEKELSDLNKAPLAKIKEGNICNTWSCDDGLKCAPDPSQLSNGKLKKGGEFCNEGSECVSTECVEEKMGSKKKVCEDVYRCFRLLNLGESCINNPVCGVGQCLPFSSATSGIGECEAVGKSCKKDNDCCSNSCNGGVCKSNYICKDCVGSGGKPVRGQKCCEGLYQNRKNICVPDVPPSVIPQVHIQSPVKVFITSFVNFFISSADAGEILKIDEEFNALMTKNEKAGPGTKFDWGNGTLTVLQGGNVSYVSKTGQRIEFSDKTNIIKAANASSDLRQYIVDVYGVDPLGRSSSDHATNATTLEMMKQIEANKVATTGASTSLNVLGYGNVTYIYQTQNGKKTIPGKITTPSGKVYDPASDFYDSNEYAAMVGKKMTAEDYAYLQDEGSVAVKTDQSLEKDKTAAAALEDEENFLNIGTKADGFDVTSGIMANKDKYSNFVAKSAEADGLDMNAKKPVMEFPMKSNFATCEIRFKDDFFNALKASGTFDLEVAMLGFDFVTTGDSDNDYWRKGSSEAMSIAARLKKIGLAHREQRKSTNAKIATINDDLTCMCLDVQGLKKITNDEKKQFFINKCPQYEKYTIAETPSEEIDGDASGIKAKRLLVAWTSKLANFHMGLATENSNASKDLGAVSTWAQSADWNKVETRKYDLFKFNIKNPSSSVSALGGIVGALLAAGVIAIMGGFATTSLLSAWGAAGIIAASAVTGAGGLWVIASMKGAWISMKPEIHDFEVAPRTYSCGKKDSCTEYTRTLVQPYNDVCNIHASANACIKGFVVVNEGQEARYIVDPWIPNGVSKAAILMNQLDYAQKINDGFQAAKKAMDAKNPKAYGDTGGKKGGGDFVTESYLSEVFIDATVVGQYAPIGQNLQDTYFLNQAKVTLIKEAAKKFAIDEGFLAKGDTANLDAFADYAYEYHFLWPKKSRPLEISYPTVGLTTYLDFMTNDVSGNLSTGLVKTTQNLTNLQRQYLEDLNKNLQLYIDKPTNQTTAIDKAIYQDELNKNQKVLDNLLTFNSLLDNPALDSSALGSMSDKFMAAQSKLSGAKGVVTFSGDQKSFLQAVGNLRTTRKEQLKDLDYYKKAMAGNNNKDRANKMATLSKKFSNNFAKGKSALGNSLSSSAGVGAGNGSGSGSSADDANSKNGKNGSGKDGQYGNGGGAGSGSGGLYGYGSGSGGSKSGNSSGSGSGADSAANGSNSANGSGMSDEDRKKLQEAIDARNAANNKEKYNSSDKLGLFEKITNAYIRNYDKVLSKKKDKDVIEDKQ